MTSFSFSGIDGAGKSTQISALKALADAAGLTVVCLEFWDDIVAFSRFREYMSHKAFKGDEGIGSPEKPLNRRDKNVTSWPVTVLRFFFYTADSLSLWWTTRKLRQRKIDIVIFDRYIYDEMANLPLQRSVARAFVKALLTFAPKPDAALLIDADPEAARSRKPEYPLDFLRKNRAAYLDIARLAGMTVIEPSTIDEAEAKIRRVFLSKIASVTTHLAVVPSAE